MSFVVNKQVRATRLSDGKQRVFNTVKEAADTCKVSVEYVKRSATDPYHISHNIHRWVATTQKGKIRSRKMPEFKFEFILDKVVTLIPLHEGGIDLDFPSVVSCAKFLGVTQPTLRARFFKEGAQAIVRSEEGLDYIVVKHGEVKSDIGKKLREGENVHEDLKELRKDR